MSSSSYETFKQLEGQRLAGILELDYESGWSPSELDKPEGDHWYSWDDWDSAVLLVINNFDHPVYYVARSFNTDYSSYTEWGVYKITNYAQIKMDMTKYKSIGEYIERVNFNPQGTDGECLEDQDIELTLHTHSKIIRFGSDGTSDNYYPSSLWDILGENRDPYNINRHFQ